MIYLYNLLWGWVITLGWPVLIPFMLMNPKRRLTCLPRLGLVPLLRRQPPGNRVPDGHRRPIWVHALSVGEVLSAAPLVQGLQDRLPEYPIALSTSSLSGFTIARERLGERVDWLFYYPYDVMPTVGYVQHKIDPALVVVVETDIWPNFVWSLQRRDVPVMLVNGRLSETSYRRYRRLKVLFRPIFTAFEQVTAQSAQNAVRFRNLGVDPAKLAVVGNLKFDRPAPDGTGPILEQLSPWQQSPSGSLKILLAGSTHEGEETIIGSVFKRLRARQPDLKLMIAPRDPIRARAVQRLFNRTDYRAVLWDAPSACRIHADTDIVIVGFIGILAQLYAVADVAFVGGSLIPHGGQNPLEAAAFAKPILVGPHTFNFDDITRRLIEAGGAQRVGDEETFFQAASGLLESTAAAQAAGERARQVFQSNRGALAKTLDMIAETLNTSIAGT